MKKLITGFQLTALIAFIFYSQFHNLGNPPFHIWDESHLATNAYEMEKSGDFLVPTIDWNPDMSSTKPPLMLWAQVMFIKFYGLNELSIRLPAAICAALTTLLVAWFVFYLTANRWAALLSVIVLCTARGYIGGHGIRFGEYDSMLTLFTTAYLFSLFIYTESQGSKRNKYLLLFFVALTFGVLTKGIAALLFSPALFIYLLFRKQLLDTFANRYFYIGLASFLVFILAYYFSREHFNHGYLTAVSDQELGGRFNRVIEGHVGGWDYYWGQLKLLHFGNWYWALPVSVLFVWFMPEHRTKRAVTFFLLCAFLFIAVISFSQTKLEWYDIPCFPLFAVIIALLVLHFANILPQFKYINKQLALVVLIMIFSIQPVIEGYAFLNWLNKPDDLSKDNSDAVSYYFRDAINGKRDLKNDIYFFTGYCIQWRLYVKRLSDLGTGVNDQMLWGGNKFKLGQKLIVNQEAPEIFIKAHYEYKILDEFYGVKQLELTAIK